MIKELLLETRSYRRFQYDKKISYKELCDIVEAARFCPCTANMQRLRFALISDEETASGVFETLSFAALLRPWVRPEPNERPVAYIVVLGEREPDVNLSIDVGISAEAMLLTAKEKGIVGCMFRSFNKDNLSKVIGREGYMPYLVIALGYPGEEVVLEDGKPGELKYYRDENGVHHVPKLKLEDLIV